MAEKLVSGAVLYRKLGGRTEWLVVKSGDDEKWELPKIEAKRGESSVMAVLRYVRDVLEQQTRVLEEAGRETLVRRSNGEEGSERLIFYLMEKFGRDALKSREGKWLTNSAAQKRVALSREQRMLKQANDVLREWRRKEKEEQS